MKSKTVLSIIVVVLIAGFNCAFVKAENRLIAEVFNQALEAVVLDVIKTKSVYPELEDFNQSVIGLDAGGYSTIAYEHKATNSDGSQDPYAYQLTVGLLPLSSPESDLSVGYWEQKFPLLGYKVFVETKNKGNWASFDIRRIVDSHLDGLRELEQESLPFRLQLSVQEGGFVINEPILINVSLMNKGSKAFRMAELNEYSLSCQMGSEDWGNLEGEIEMNTVLNPGRSITGQIEIPGKDTPQDLSVSCVYAIAYKGVQPFNRIKVSIKPKS